MRKIFFLAVQIEKTEIYILQKEWGKRLFLPFKLKQKNYFWISLTPYSALTPLIKIHRQLSQVTRNAVWYFICARELFLIWLFHRKLAFVLVKFSLCQDEKFLPIFVFEEVEEAKIWWNPQVQCRTRSLALSDRGSHCNQEEWLKKLEDASPANEAKGQNTTSASRTKLL